MAVQDIADPMTWKDSKVNVPVLGPETRCMIAIEKLYMKLHTQISKGDYNVKISRIAADVFSSRF